MIIDTNQIDNNKIFKGDLCIIGSGPAGLTIANKFAKSNLDIIVIPGGEFKITEKNQELCKGIVDKDVSHEPLDEYQHRVFGGSGNFWGGRCLPLDKIDFEQRSWISNTGWPIKINELKPYYKIASKLLKLNRFNFEFDPNIIPSDKNEIIEGLNSDNLTSNKIERWSSLLNFSNEFKNLFLKKNFTLLKNAHANKINANKDKIDSVSCIIEDKKVFIKAKHFVLASGGIENPRLLLVSKNNLHPKGIGNKKNLVGRYYMAHHSGIFLNLDPYNREKILYKYEKDLDGVYCRRRWWITDTFQKKEKIGNIIFFLSHANDPKGIGYGGYIYSFVHLLKFIISLYKKIFRSNYKFSLKKKEKEFLIVNFKLFIKNFFVIIPKIIIIAFQRLKKNRLPSVLPEKNSKFLGLYFQAEQTPCYDSRIIVVENRKDSQGIPKVKVKIKFNKIDKKTILKAHEYFVQRFIKIKAGKFQKKYNKKILTNLLEKQIKNFNSGSHYLGTTRMAKNDETGVVDKNCKVFGFKNLFIAGSSVFPTGGHANPTLTIVALALRLSDYLQKKLKK